MDRAVEDLERHVDPVEGRAVSGQDPRRHVLDQARRELSDARTRGQTTDEGTQDVHLFEGALAHVEPELSDQAPLERLPLEAVPGQLDVALEDPRERLPWHAEQDSGELTRLDAPNRGLQIEGRGARFAEKEVAGQVDAATSESHCDLVEGHVRTALGTAVVHVDRDVVEVEAGEPRRIRADGDRIAALRRVGRERDVDRERIEVLHDFALFEPHSEDRRVQRLAPQLHGPLEWIEACEIDFALDIALEPGIRGLRRADAPREVDRDRSFEGEVGARALERLDHEGEPFRARAVFEHDRAIGDLERSDRERERRGLFLAAAGRRCLAGAGRQCPAAPAEAREVEAIGGLDHADRRSVEADPAHFDPAPERRQDPDAHEGFVEREKVGLPEARVFSDAQPGDTHGQSTLEGDLRAVEGHASTGGIARQLRQRVPVLLEVPVQVRDRDDDHRDHDHQQDPYCDRNLAHRSPLHPARRASSR